MNGNVVKNPEFNVRAVEAGGVSAHAGELSRFHRDDFDRDVWCVLGMPVDNITIDGLVAAVDQAVAERRRLSLVTPNVNWLVRVGRDAQSRNETIVADLSVADGAPVVALAKLLGAPIRSRVAGSDLFEALRRRPRFARQPLRVFLFGGRNGAAEAAAKSLNAEAGGVEIVGWRNPGFGDVASMSDDETIAAINAVQPDFVLVALGAAKGQAWIDANQSRLNAPVLAHLGAVIDFAGGGIQRAPNFFQKAGLEWAWRIKEEPTLWRRYASDFVSLFGMAVRCASASLTSIASHDSYDGEVECQLAGDEAIVRLAGDINYGMRNQLRSVLRAAVEYDRDILLDFGGARSLDAAALGLLLMLEKHVVQSGRAIYQTGAGRRVRSILAANAFRFAVRDLAPVELDDISAAVDAA